MCQALFQALRIQRSKQMRSHGAYVVRERHRSFIHLHTHTHTTGQAKNICNRVKRKRVTENGVLV